MDVEDLGPLAEPADYVKDLAGGVVQKPDSIYATVVNGRVAFVGRRGDRQVADRVLKGRLAGGTGSSQAGCPAMPQ